MDTALEYKERLLRQLSGDAYLAERHAEFITLKELPYAETSGYADALQDQIDTATNRALWLRAAALVIEDVNTGL